MQLLDELSMIYTTCFMCYSTFSYARSTVFSYILGTALAGLSWFITVCADSVQPAILPLTLKPGQVLPDQRPPVSPRRIYCVDRPRTPLQYVYNGVQRQAGTAIKGPEEGTRLGRPS